VKIVEFSNYGAMWKGLVNNEADAAFASTISGRRARSTPRAGWSGRRPGSDKAAGHA